jgi:hypothetical protein
VHPARKLRRQRGRAAASYIADGPLINRITTVSRLQVVRDECQHLCDLRSLFPLKGLVAQKDSKNKKKSLSALLGQSLTEAQPMI